MKNKLTLLQNFIITDDIKLNHLQSSVGIKKTAEVFGECKTIVNYKTKLYLDEIKSLYKDNFKTLSFHNWVDSDTFNWAETTLKLLQEVKTPYVFYLTEDRMFCNTSVDEFSSIINEMVNNDIAMLNVGKLPKYSTNPHPSFCKSYGVPAYENNNTHIYTFDSKNSPYGCISLDAIFRVDIFKECLERIIKCQNEQDYSHLIAPHHGKWTWSKFKSYIGRPHILELASNWITKEKPHLKLAVPKNLAVVSDDDLGYTLGPGMKISLIQPGRNNLKYLKWSYDSIRKNQGIHNVEICVADDFSSDGTWDWCQEMMKKDPNFKAIRNEGPTRLGHTILYDRLINEVATNDICMIYHADMYLCPGALDAIKDKLKEKTIVSLTRIEPPLHPDGPEKILKDFGIEPEEFKEQDLLDFLSLRKPTNDITEGIFAPWAFYKKDFQEIGGHDPIFAPQSKEDTDIFNRFQLNGIKFIQTWEGCVYHMTCRGSRFADGAKRNPNGEVFMKNRETDEWLKQNQKSTREFLRKWGHYCKHDSLMKPIIPPKYDVGFIIKNSSINLLNTLEPWCGTVYVSTNRKDYITSEQPNTSFNLSERVKPLIIEANGIPHNNEINNHILVEIDGNNFNQQDYLIIQQLSEILADSGEVGEFELGNLKININSLETFENDLIFITNSNNEKS